MNAQNQAADKASDARHQFEVELSAVDEHLLLAADDLGGPLAELVRPRILAARPLVRAGLTLCVGYDGPGGDPEGRIFLAAALEMLYVALSIHQLLVDSVTRGQPSDVDQAYRSFAGSTILAGDYCFSRAAQMATQTNNPKVVAIFAQALQDVSESRLRDLFHDQGKTQHGPPGERDKILMRSGAKAAAELSDLPRADRSALFELTESVAAYLFSDRVQAKPCGAAMGALPSPHQQRWRAFCDYLAELRTVSNADSPNYVERDAVPRRGDDAE